VNHYLDGFELADVIVTKMLQHMTARIAKWTEAV